MAGLLVAFSVVSMDLILVSVSMANRMAILKYARVQALIIFGCIGFLGFHYFTRGWYSQSFDVSPNRGWKYEIEETSGIDKFSNVASDIIHIDTLVESAQRGNPTEPESSSDAIEGDSQVRFDTSTQGKVDYPEKIVPEGGTPIVIPKAVQKKDAFQKSYVHRFLGDIQDDKVEDVLYTLANCTTINCAIQSHDRIRGRTRFNLPHFFLAGWPESGSEILLEYLSQHPQFIRGTIDNPHWFTFCKPGEANDLCKAYGEEKYLKDVLKVKEAAEMKLEVATVDASDDYGRKGAVMARRLYRLFPWAKIVIILREPVSRIVTHLRNAEMGELEPILGCEEHDETFSCLLERFRSTSNDCRYYDSIQGWLITFPTSQILVLQYEELIENPKKVFFDLMIFLGLNPSLFDDDFVPASIPSSHAVEPLSLGRGQYQRLARNGKEDAFKLLAMLERYGLADTTSWMSRWQAIWDANVMSCPKESTDKCKFKAGMN